MLRREGEHEDGESCFAPELTMIDGSSCERARRGGGRSMKRDRIRVFWKVFESVNGSDKGGRWREREELISTVGF